MSDIAAETGLSTGGLYRYFPGKEEVFAAVIADLHERLFEASAGHGHALATDPEAALLAANLGYLRVYHENRDVMRSFIQASEVDDRFREIWWRMRDRHVDRFLGALAQAGIQVDANARLRTEALACMTEQCAYVWFAHDARRHSHPTVAEAAQVVSDAWVRAFFGGR